jgi:AhpD family alkylhydroperoxidase
LYLIPDRNCYRAEHCTSRPGKVGTGVGPLAVCLEAFFYRTQPFTTGIRGALTRNRDFTISRSPGFATGTESVRFSMPFWGIRRLARNLFCISRDRFTEKNGMDDAKGHSLIKLLDLQNATGKMRRLIQQAQTKFGLVPNLFRLLANASVALEGFVHLSETLSRGAVDESAREHLALAIAESNLCAYCLHAHTGIAGKIGLSRIEVDDAIRASGANGRTDAILKLALGIVVHRGELSDADLARACRRVERGRDRRDGRQRRAEHFRELHESRRADLNRVSARRISGDIRSGRRSNGNAEGMSI